MDYKFGTRDLVVPDEWIYSYYAGVKEPMDGRNIRIFSVFTNERTPSMFLYVRNRKYVWKDHSSGHYGDAIDLTKHIFTQSSGELVSYRAAMHQIRLDYTKWIKEHGEYKPSKLEVDKYAYDLLCEYTLRDYEEYDILYWGPYGGTHDILKRYNIMPLLNFKIGKKYKGGTVWNKPCVLKYSYGFFSENGDLLKIYNPYNVDFKHVTLKEGLLGSEQLTNKHRTLVIASSMKDLVSLVTLGMEIDVVAPMGEKIIIKQDIIGNLKQIYPNIVTLLDNDATGIRAMILYKRIYDLDFVYIPHYKDIADLRRSTIEAVVKRTVAVAINKTISKRTGNEQTVKKETNSQGWKAIEIPGFGGF